ncbi:MAG: polysaccharide deacetylase family protein [Promicromonosporaceae bacterium]|nr:polysaccharide deacetylase family protein [Promicromonosporaceae bacterium]
MTDAGRVQARRLVKRLAVAVAAAVVLALVAPLGVNAIATHRPVLGLEVAGASRREVWSDSSAVAQKVAARRAGAGIEVGAGGHAERRTLGSLGLVDAAPELHARMLGAGRDGSFWQDAVTQTRAAWGMESVAPPPDRFDGAHLDAALEALAPQVAVAPKDAAVTLEAGTVTVAPDVPGRRLDVPRARQAVIDAVQAGRSSVDLPTAPVPATVPAATLEGAAATVRAAVERPLSLVAGGARVTVPAERVFAALPVTVAGGKASVHPDPAGLAADVDALAGKVDAAPQLRIILADVVVAPGVEGRRLDKVAASAALAAEVKARAGGGGTETLTVPVATLPFAVQQATPGAFTGDQTVHLTFDDGPGAHTEQILDILKAKGVHATFYAVGNRAKDHPDTLRRILAEGHRLGNHSTTHPDLTKLTRAQVEAEIVTTQDTLTQITGLRPTAFRPPYGAVDDVVRQVAAEQHLSVDLWTVDPEDWKQPGAAVVRDRVLAAARPGSVVLLHVLTQGTVDALPGIIDGLRAKGFALD